MRNVFRHTEWGFERLVSAAIRILGNSTTFMVALIVVVYWLSGKSFYAMNVHDILRDYILGVTFLSLFIIQKSFNRFSASLHLKVNELVASHEPASNEVINTEEKTEYELNQLSRVYAGLAKEIKDEVIEKDTRKTENAKSIL